MLYQSSQLAVMYLLSNLLYLYDKKVSCYQAVHEYKFTFAAPSIFRAPTLS